MAREQPGPREGRADLGGQHPHAIVRPDQGGHRSTKLEFPTRGAVATLHPTLQVGRARQRKAPVEVAIAEAAREDKPLAKAKVSGTSHRFPTKLHPDTEYSWSVSVAGRGDRQREVPHVAGCGDPEPREAASRREGRVLRSPALRASPAGERRGPGGAGGLGQARPGACRPSRAREPREVGRGEFEDGSHGVFAARAPRRAARCIAVVARAADPVAFVSDMRGDVLMNGAGRPAFLAELLPGTKLSLGTGCRCRGDVRRERRGVHAHGAGRFRRHQAGRECGERAGARQPQAGAAGQRIGAGPDVEDRHRQPAHAQRARAQGNAGRPGLPGESRIATLQPTLQWIGEPDAAYTSWSSRRAARKSFAASPRAPG